MKKILTAAAMAGAAIATPALAQDAAAEAPAPAAQAPAPAAEAAAEVAITDAELDMFAGAAIKVNEIAQNAELDAEAKQAAMVEAVQNSGLDPVKFNEIATKSQSDETMKARVAEAFARRPAPAATAEAEAEASPAEQAGG